MPDNVARKYLIEHHGIEAVLTRYQLSNDLSTSVMDNTSKGYYPTLINFARDVKGNINGVKLYYLNKETTTKANIAVNKRSFGKISGLFVKIQPSNEYKKNITIIAEGVETALVCKKLVLKAKSCILLESITLKIIN